MPSPFPPVGVPPDCPHRCDLSQIIQDFLRADIAGMNYQVDSLQCIYRLGAQQTVSVGNDAEAHKSVSS